MNNNDLLFIIAIAISLMSIIISSMAIVNSIKDIKNINVKNVKKS